MARKRCGSLSGRLGRLSRRLEAWRQRKGKAWGRIPEPMWEEAVALAREHGVHAVVRALRLDYYTLKRRLSEGAAEETAGGSPEFVELPFAKPESSAGWTVELQDGAERRMRIAGPVGCDPDWMELMRAFWRGAE